MAVVERLSFAFDFPPHAFHFSIGFLFGLGAAARIGVYDYLGYYDICYIGDEVRHPGQVIPRSIIISLIAVAQQRADQPTLSRDVSQRNKTFAREKLKSDPALAGKLMRLLTD